MRRRLNAVGLVAPVLLAFAHTTAASSRPLKERPVLTVHEASARWGTHWVTTHAYSRPIVPWKESRAEAHRRLLRRARRHCGFDDLKAQPDSPRQRIVFASDRDGDFEIFVMNVDGSDVRQITHNDVDDVRPDWAPDGRRIVFSRTDRLRIANVDSDTDCPLGFFGQKVHGTHPTWSPDGKWIAYSWGDCYGMAVIASRLDGARDAWFTDGSESWVAMDPAWAPDSRSLVYEDHDANAFVLEDLKRAGRHKYEELLWLGTRGEAAVAPDGKTLMISIGSEFHFDEDMPHDAHYLAVGVKGALQRVEATDTSTSLAGAWSPDGGRIVFYSDRFGSFDIFTIGPTGVGLTRLTTHTGNDITPDWSS